MVMIIIATFVIFMMIFSRHNDNVSKRREGKEKRRDEKGNTMEKREKEERKNIGREKKREKKRKDEKRGE